MENGKNNRILLRNEFASVEIMKDDSANGPRLLVRDLEDGSEIYLDPLEVESLTRRAHADFAEFVRPE
ncbi:hypothetical protein GBA65_17200 [Rubrobacter marinus]|uniref:Uncharacterized protein n=1 Tax=Rubrobacter marinus TaxID=2653852 RepID=A0A6G8Q0F6_9ACTN|nr:hypothetical protein [Rubrobacter marinus]QIN79969.1 hypothetical protein GBA65_17200 [Rubrobacter marinus]